MVVVQLIMNLTLTLILIIIWILATITTVPKAPRALLLYFHFLPFS